MKSIIIATLLALAPGVGFSETIISRKDSLGFTHYRGSSGNGISHDDSLGYRHTEWRSRDGKTTRCISRKNSLGQTITECH